MKAQPPCLDDVIVGLQLYEVNIALVFYHGKQPSIQVNQSSVDTIQHVTSSMCETNKVAPGHLETFR